MHHSDDRKMEQNSNTRHYVNRPTGLFVVRGLMFYNDIKSNDARKLIKVNGALKSEKYNTL